MKSFSLIHRRGLRYPAGFPRIDFNDIQVRNPEQTTVVAFASGGEKVCHLDARDRFQETLTQDVVLIGFDNSPLDAQIFWDIAHLLPVGGLVYLRASGRVTELLSKRYYKDSFKPYDQEYGGQAFVKCQPLPAEAERGLDAWSFCIPTGDGDPSALNACVARILSLNVPRFEIILCGRPHADFLYWEHVRIVGEDIPAPPVHITRKKNVLARAATLSNLCILHDRVLLPHNFMEAVHCFGDDYPFTAFQSFWFADTWHGVPRRYSDAAVAFELPAFDFSGERMARNDVSLFEPKNLALRHPARGNFGLDYLTGSLYLCKKSVWEQMPQNEALYWQDYEDLEQGFCAAQAGIPSSINTYAFTVTQSYRSLMHSFGLSHGMAASGKTSVRRAPQELWGLPRRPHLPLTETAARARLMNFARKYTGSDRLVRQAGSLRGFQRYVLAVRLLWAANGNISTLINDWFRDVLCEAAGPIDEQFLQAVLDSNAAPFRKKMIMLRHHSLVRQIYNNPFSSAFQREDGRLPEVSYIRRGIGSMIGAVWLKYASPHTSLRIPLLTLWRLIYTSMDKEEGKP